MHYFVSLLSNGIKVFVWPLPSALLSIRIRTSCNSDLFHANSKPFGKRFTFLSKVIPLFLERKKKCAIINLSSQSIFYKLKTLSVYTATKAFNSIFSECLAQDYLGTNVKIKVSSMFLTVLQLLCRQLAQTIQKIQWQLLLNNV